MTSQIVFMEHNPITTWKRARSPSSLSNFLHNLCQFPSSYRHREYLEYFPESLSEYHGSFRISILTGQVEFKGKFFRNQEAVNTYLIERGIAIKLGLVNFTAISQRGGGRGSVLFIEEMKYSEEHLSSMAISRAKALLKIPRSPEGDYNYDHQFLGIKAGKFVHTRSGDLIPPNEWIPLYRPGSIFKEVLEDAPINLEEVEHVIF